jgi:hypothetical protein
MPSIGKGAQLQIRGMWSAGPGDDQARFLADLRSLRDTAAIGYDELAARAHFPSDILKEAENGPVLPGLPILTAYVRACEGDVTEWEERWRRLASEVPEDPGLPVRPAGASPAAVAGARAGVGIAPPEVYDPERIRAALRGGHGGSDQGGRKTNGAGWDTPADQTIKTANGNHTADHWSAQPTDTADHWSAQPTDTPDHWSAQPTDTPDHWSAQPTDTPDHWSAQPTDAADHWSAQPTDTAATPEPAKNTEDTNQFQWLPDNGSASRLADKGQADTRQADTVDVAPAEPTAGEWTSWHGDRVLETPERTDFWATQNTAASADVRLPTTAPYRVEEQDVTQPVRSTPAETTVASSARSGAGKTTATEGADHQKDRFVPVRLLVILVIAALIGSAVVLLLK